MKGKRYTTEEKIRILREADAGKSILDVCREHNISDVSFHRWKKQFGQLEINEARRLRELERENTELKKLLAESLLKNRVLEAVCEKNCKPGASAGVGADHRGGGGLLRACGVPHPAVVALHLLVSGPTAFDGSPATVPAVAGVVRRTSPLRLSADRGATAPGGLAGGQAPGAASASSRGVASAAHETQGRPAWRFDRIARQSHPSWSRLDLGLHRRMPRCAGERCGC